ncbi:hypothetical protein BST27_30825 [Mycobacterium intermedium]|uniref:Uncharacterized protein n=1 Tax=Mycobacterium intermedium TaxID=28445 RepID=A0A1E3SFG0_MYCIE|nr:hypothetical protein [Mycobacterium intermedium]MCV6965923.1 hypothetical protein [Mycobacterium intermedium]ODR00393.1 hypothetical protein BHQ20_13680 [Mycobacterium intermedium]OPE51098.1 hypothetical protein BV508_08045 [Mycobacterium intermedium]ORA84339.1 hypothetical protein BST27_30825 [Mycobacterium intermedium]
MTDNAGHLLDYDRSVCLCDVGQADYFAATAVTAGGDEHLVLARRAAIGDPTACYDSSCRDVAHEQLGALPLEYVRHITVSRRTHRCGRPTQAGRPCRIRVPAQGQACEWHRTKADA